MVHSRQNSDKKWNWKHQIFDVSNMGPKASFSFVNRYANIFCLQINASRHLEKKQGKDCTNDVRGIKNKSVFKFFFIARTKVHYKTTL